METEIQLIVRWIHVIAGVAWIGHLYFFNFVNVPLQGALDDAGKKAVNPQLMPRALWWFRWGAMITFLAGLALFYLMYMQGGLMREADGALSLRAKWIMGGMALGIIMWFNVWFIIWPAQKKLLGGTAGEAAPALRKRAMLASRTNTYLSAPMLVGMVAGSHVPTNSAVMCGVAAVSLLVVWLCIKASYGVGKTV
ncbi:MAG: hypothetical protein A3G34_02525 [Candidatus Lindowbacteria bacterium RIFCSPLOWO2_12_FULL_62_27]|nr:MAG: hypothetical protein A3G34_02525 [Candidatus Lindowbacteria bacterium RIFCSPLOWO2_12_FULL_62_27]